MKPQSPITYVSPAPSPIPVVPPPAVPVETPTLTGEAKTVQDLIGRIRQENTTIAGKEAYKIEQQQAQDVAGKRRVVRDLTNQLLGIKANEATIPLNLEQGAQGRGITTTILGRQQQELLRQNTIKALTVQVQLSAAQGDLQTALDAVDRMVDTKYKPLEAERDANVANADLILKSPLYTQEEKNRAEAVKAKEEEKSRAREISKSATSSILTLLADQDFQLSAPASVKNELSKLAQKVDLTTADVVYAQNLGARYKKSITEEVAGNKITLTESKNLGLPPTAVGLTENQVAKDLSSADPPAWFITSEQEKERRSLSGQELQKRWDSYKKEQLLKTPAQQETQQKEARVQELLLKSSNGANLDALTPEELTELYSNL